MGRAVFGLSVGIAMAVAPASLRAQDAATEVSVQGTRPASRDFDQTVQASEARRMPATHDDPIQVVQDLAGIARPSFDSGQLVVWGSAPQDTQTFVDGVPIPQLFHGSAIRAVVNGDLVSRVTLSPGEYGASYGRSLGGIVRVETADLPERGIHAGASVDTLDGAAIVSAVPFEGGRVAAAARYGWLDDELRAVHAADVGDYFSIPRYGDYQAKAQIALRQGESLDVVVLGSEDALTRTIPDLDPSHVRSQSTSTSFERVYLKYRRELDGGAVAEVVPWIGHDASHLEDHFGDNPAVLDQQAFRWGGRAWLKTRALRAMSVTVGLDVDGSSAVINRQGSPDIPPREGDVVVFGEPPGSGFDTDSWSAAIVGVAPYVSADWTLGPLALTPGLRLDTYLLETSRQTPRVGQTPSIALAHLDGVLEPSLSADVRVTPAWSLVGGAAVTSEPPAASDLSAVFGTPWLGPSSATVFSLGQALRAGRRLQVEMLGFYKWLDTLAVRDPSATPKLAQSLLEDGVGRAYGIQWLVRLAPWNGLSGWVAYTISRSERRDAPGGGFRLFDYDEPHVVTLVASQTWGPYAFGVRLRYATGLPRTPVVGALYAANEDVYQPIFGRQNSIRLPDFWQLDLRIDRAFSLGGALGRSARLRVYAEALNATDQRNGEEYAYSFDYSRRGLVYGIPLVGVVGLRVDR
jgi:hypothetical protein